MPLEADSLLAHFRLLSPIGEGGMGVVWRALDVSLGREVALKFLPDAMAGDRDRLAMFEREARILAALNHPNIVAIYSVEEGDGRRFLAMELVDGEPLSSLIPEDGMALERLLDIALPLTDAIAAAHQRGVTHRDIKPANVVIRRDGQVKVLDFGVATLAPDGDADRRNTLQTWGGTVHVGAAGTLAYMSPEQVAGGATDCRSDLFSLGSLLFEMATGRHPFSATNPVELVTAILRDRPSSPLRWKPHLPDPLVRVINTCLEKNPHRRPASADAVRDVLCRSSTTSAPGGRRRNAHSRCSRSLTSALRKTRATSARAWPPRSCRRCRACGSPGGLASLVIPLRHRDARRPRHRRGAPGRHAARRERATVGTAAARDRAADRRAHRVLPVV